ncbi:putative membrane protein [Microbacterium resistens]|uniref:Membrane protein n=1 Tax=Microbacterium resistens TaxID=156977 RepID=A0ABU1SF61_9MICO|nr:DUF998 domain-containing protein [Microbacterium resistens]MDR6868231.1 putative membrane protein [Microbacterium resistens]
MTERSVNGQDAAVRTAGLLWAIGPLWYMLCEAVTAVAFPGYDYAHFYISDLGVPDHALFESRMLASTVPQVMDAGFIGSGLFFLLGLILLVPYLRRGFGTICFAVIGVLHAAGIVFVGLVPGSPTNAENGLMIIHVLGAFAAIAGGNVAAILSASAMRPLLPTGRLRFLGVVLGVLGLVSATLLTMHLWLPDGVWERGAVYSFLLWQCVLGWVLQRPRILNREPAPDYGPTSRVA